MTLVPAGPDAGLNDVNAVLVTVKSSVLVTISPYVYKVIFPVIAFFGTVAVI